MKPASNLIGRRYGRLTVVSRLENIKGNTNWSCLCDCGVETTAIAALLNRGDKQSCGCLQRERAGANLKTHGLSKTAAYGVWCGMVKRCSNPAARDFARYGGRGISVCDRWKDFENFYADMGAPPSGMTIERRDNDGPYSPDNCEWATRATQGANTSRVIRVVVDGKQKSLRQACADMGLKYQTILMRIYRGSSVEEALS